MMPMTAMGRVTVSMSMTIPARATTPLQLSLQVLSTLPKPSHDLPNVSYTVKVQLELVDLGIEGMEPRNLPVGIINQVAGAVIHLHVDLLRLLY